MSRVTYFILRIHTGTGVTHSQHRKNLGEVWEKNTGGWTRRVEISKAEISGSRHSMHGGNADLLQALKGEPLSSEYSTTDGILISASAVPHCGVFISFMCLLVL